MSRRALAGLLALGLAACGGLKSTLPEVPQPASLAGVPTPALGLAALDGELTRLQAELERRLMGRSWGVPLQLSRPPQPMIRVRLGADETFAAGSAQLEPRSLALYAELAEVLKASPSVVTHVLAHGDAPTSDEPWTDLSARRAASVHDYLASRGVPVTRLRAEGRAAREPATADPAAGAVNRRVELVLRVVVAGSEAEAWMPPPPSAACLPCSADE